MIPQQLTDRQQALIANWLRRKHLPPLGYTFDRTHTYFVLDPEVAPLVLQAFEQVLTGVMPIEVLRRLNEELGFRTPPRGQTGGKPLARGAFYRILHDPFYCGKIRSRFGIVAGEHEAIVNAEDFERIQVLLAGRGRRPSHDKSPTGGRTWICVQHHDTVGAESYETLGRTARSFDRSNAIGN